MSGEATTTNADGRLDFKRLKFFRREAFMYGANEVADLGEPDWPRYIRITDIKDDGSLYDEDRRSLPPDVAVPYLLEDGDLLFARSGATVGKAFLYRSKFGPACFAGYLIRFRGRKTELDPEFLKYLTETRIYDHFIRQSTIQATIQNVSAERYGELLVPILSLSRQRAIIDFLDAKLERLDELMGKKERQLALLAEKRQSLISHAVTRGLNRNAKTKSSGISWLGNIPEHWQAKRIKYCFHFLDHRRIPLSSEERSIRQGPYPYYGASGIIDSIDGYLFDEPLLLFGEDGANLVCRSTPLAFVASGKYWVNNHAHILKPKFGALSYWEHALNLLDVRPSVTGSAQPKLTAEALGNIAVPAPPTEEQIKIGAHLHLIETATQKLVEKIKAQLAKFHEFRQALITAAVTGQIEIPEGKV